MSTVSGGSVQNSVLEQDTRSAVEVGQAILAERARRW